MPSQISSSVAPSIAALLGLTGLIVGSRAFFAPLQTIQAFGLTPPPAATTSAHAQAFQTSLIKAYGIRNVGNALVGLGLVSAWYLEVDGARKEAVRTCLGIWAVAGTVVAAGDAWAVGQFVEGEGVVETDVGSGKKAAQGHGIAAALIATVGGILLL